MVKYKTILQIMEDYVVKCPTIAEMHSQLANMTQEEKEDAFFDESLLNMGEAEVYLALLKKKDFCEREIEYYENLLESGDNDESFNKDMVEHFKGNVKDIEEKLFQFERRIIEGYKKESLEPPKVDISNFKEDVQITDLDNDTIKPLEQAQIDSQEKIDLTEDEVDSLRYYLGDGARITNSRLNNGHKWNNLTDEQKKEKGKRSKEAEKDISNAIKKSEGLKQDTVLYHGGEFDVTKMVGDKVKFKGYTSASFQQGVSDQFQNYSTVPKENYYTFKILAKKGTKGICANDRSRGKLSSNYDEHEYLLDKGLEGDIVDIDYENHIVTLAI